MNSRWEQARWEQARDPVGAPGPPCVAEGGTPALLPSSEGHDSTAAFTGVPGVGRGGPRDEGRAAPGAEPRGDRGTPPPERARSTSAAGSGDVSSLTGHAVAPSGRS